MVALAAVRDVAQDRDFAAGWVEQAGQALERGGLAGAFGSEETDDLGLGDIE
jgi:hypothetical protein